MPKKKKKPKQLPDCIIPLTSSDKEGWTETWYEGRNLLNIPVPWRMILASMPSGGKTCLLKNFIVRQDPPFDKIMVVHYDPEGSDEWDDVNAEMLPEIPDPRDIKREGRKLLIFEDMDLSAIPKEHKSRLNRLFGYCSSHKNLSIAVTAQDSFSIPTCARRTSNVFCLWKVPDLVSMAQVAKRTGLKSDELLSIMREHIHSNHDFLMIDITENTPASLRINGYQVLEKLK